MKNFSKRDYFSLKDLLNDCQSWDDKYYYGNYSTSITIPGALFADIIGTSAPSSHIVDSVESKKLFVNYILPKYVDEIVGYVDDNESPTLVEKYIDFCIGYLGILNNTYIRYKKLIDLYSAAATHLMDEVKSTSVNKFNDTPQANNMTDDTHLTNLTRVENADERGTQMQRLDEINKNFDDIYTQWAEEFGKLFIES